MIFSLSSVLQRYDLETNGVRGYIYRTYGQTSLATFDQTFADLPTTDRSPNLWNDFLDFWGTTRYTSENFRIYAPIKDYLLGKENQQLTDLNAKRVYRSMSFVPKALDDEVDYYGWPSRYVQNNTDYFDGLTEELQYPALLNS